VKDEERHKGQLIRDAAAFAPPVGDALREPEVSTGVAAVVAKQRSPEASLLIFLWQQWLRDLIKEFEGGGQLPPEPVQLSRLMRERLAWLERDSEGEWRILQRDPAYERELIRDLTRTRDNERSP
jgi:hypothetical protein